MSHFSEAFWSSDYAGGLGVLFGKLQQGVHENQQVLTIARMRADAEELYGQHVGDIGPATDKISDGFSRDDGASVRKAFDGMRTEMEEASQKHKKIASNIRELVVYPFGRWCDQHASRVQNSQDDLQGRIKAHDRQADAVRKLRSHYFNKCRLVEDLEEEDKLAFQEPSEASSSPKQQTPTVKVTPEAEEEDDPEPVEIGDNYYQPEQLKKILTHMLDNVQLGETKVPILGTYQNTASGSDIVEYIQKHMGGTSVSYAERVGQDLVSNGFLRLVGNVGRDFANSTRMKYQFRPKAFQMTGYPEKKKGLERSNTTLSNVSSEIAESPIVGTVGEYLAGWNPLNNPYPNETPAQRLRREAKEADERYKAGIQKQDVLRCTLEEAMVDHLKFMERCELDRLKAIKSVILDFSGAISNSIPSLQSTVDKMMLFQETVQPLNDLRYLLENYRTGPFVPRVQPYENYYNSVDEQTFGIDLEARARSDKKRVPLIVTTILTHLDNNYPLLEGDENRRAIWIVDVPLAATHRLRNEVNNGKPISSEVLARYELPIVASLLKLYLLELPDSLVSSGLYEIIKTIYSTQAAGDSNDESAASTRISVLQNTLGQLRLANIATLDAISTHFARLIDLTTADETYVNQLTATLAPCMLRPRTESALQFEEKYNQRFLRDLFANKDTIFGELKRNSTLTHSASVARAASTAGAIPNVGVDGRHRAISTDESNRRAHMEERQRAIANRSRASSPAPGARDHHQRDHSTNVRHKRESSRGPETRFPVHPVGGAATTPRANNHDRNSLEVPASPTAHGSTNNASPPGQQHTSIDSAVSMTSDGIGSSAAVDKPLPRKPHIQTGSLSSTKRDSAGSQVAAGARPGPGRSSLDSQGGRPHGVELVDRPMDD
ncbi:MAG: hypothetical protein M1831_006767 [Alyxoria varia]|nr:MAG: hypothetical protein M1831_006767 [Alyxoria varia]